MESSFISSGMTVLIDHNIEGQAALLWSTMKSESWTELYPIEMIMFGDVGLPINADDRVVWRFAQFHRMVLLTANRKMEGENSLEQTIQEENTPDSLPVLTISRQEGMRDREYRCRCAEKLLEIIVDLDNYLGAGRIFIP
jgi:hypothetical protein